jgi:hypothetical protein
LLVEDREDDVLLVTRAFEKANFQIWLDKGPEAFRPPKEAKSRLGRKN